MNTPLLACPVLAVIVILAFLVFCEICACILSGHISQNEEAK